MSDKFKGVSIEEVLFYLFSFFGLMGSNFLNISVFGFGVSISKVALLLMLPLFFFSIYRLGFCKLRLILNENRLLYIFSIIIAYSIVSVLWAISIKDWIVKNFFLVTSLFVLLNGLMIIDSKAKLKNYLLVILLPITLNALMYIYNSWAINPYSKETSFYGNVNDLSDVLLLGILITLLLSIKNRKYCIFSLIFSYLIWMTEARAVIYSIAIGVVVFVAIYYSARNKKIVHMIESICKPLPFLFCICGILIMMIIPLVLHPYERCMSSNQARVNLILNALTFFRSNWLLGIGTGSELYYMENYSLYSTFYRETYILPVHNMWLEILTEWGIVIYSCFLYLYGEILKITLTKGINNIYLLLIFSYFLINILACISVSLPFSREKFIIPYLIFMLFNHLEEL